MSRIFPHGSLNSNWIIFIISISNIICTMFSSVADCVENEWLASHFTADQHRRWYRTSLAVASWALEIVFQHVYKDLSVSLEDSSSINNPDSFVSTICVRSSRLSWHIMHNSLLYGLVLECVVITSSGSSSYSEVEGRPGLLCYWRRTLFDSFTESFFCPFFWIC